jgi:hypothetical protein
MLMMLMIMSGGLLRGLSSAALKSDCSRVSSIQHRF